MARFLVTDRFCAHIDGDVVKVVSNKNLEDLEKEVINVISTAKEKKITGVIYMENLEQFPCCRWKCIRIRHYRDNGREI